jgi:hypothetical protein
VIIMRTIIGRPRALGLALLAITALPAMAQSREIQRGAVVQARTARIREYRDTFPTYPFSDPEPDPRRRPHLSVLPLRRIHRHRACRRRGRSSSWRTTSSA